PRWCTWRARSSSVPAQVRWRNGFACRTLPFTRRTSRRTRRRTGCAASARRRPGGGCAASTTPPTVPWHRRRRPRPRCTRTASSGSGCGGGAWTPCGSTRGTAAPRYAARSPGPRQGAQLARLYASLDVFVHSGPYETLGQTVQEAAASGLPVVAPAAGGPLDLVEDGRTGYLVPPLSSAALADAVGALVADPVLRRMFGAAGRSMVLDRSWSAVGDQLVEHYSAVLGAVSAPGVAVG